MNKCISTQDITNQLVQNFKSSQSEQVAPKRRKNSLHEFEFEFYTRESLYELGKDVIGKFTAHYPQTHSQISKEAADELLAAWCDVLSKYPRNINEEALRDYLASHNPYACSPSQFGLFQIRAKGRLARELIAQDVETDWRKLSVTGRPLLDVFFWKCAIEKNGVDYFYENCLHSDTRYQVINDLKLEKNDG